MTSPKTRGQRRAELNSMNKARLAAMCRVGISGPDGSRRVIEGQYPVISWLKEEIVASILSVEYPPVAGGGPEIAGLSPGTSPREEWAAIAARGSDASLLESLAALAGTAEGRAALAAVRRQWEVIGLEPPWPVFVPVPLADALPAGGLPAGASPVPAGTTASRCTACGEVRLSYPGDRTDEWKHHPDHCPGGDAAQPAER